MFNETPVNARKCTRILTKILFLLNQVRNEDNKVNPFLFPVSPTILISPSRASNWWHERQPTASSP